VALFIRLCGVAYVMICDMHDDKNIFKNIIYSKLGETYKK